MARVHGVYLRKPPKGPSAYTSKEAALAASPTMVVPDAAFPKTKMESVKNAAFRVNSGGRGDWSPGEFFAIWEYAQDVVLRVRQKEKSEAPVAAAPKPRKGRRKSEATVEAPVESKAESLVEVIGFAKDGEVIGDEEKSLGALDDFLEEGNVETGGWVLLIGVHPYVPEGWEEIVGAPGSRRRRRG